MDLIRKFRGHRKEKVIENILQGATLTLETIQQMAQFAPVPYLSQAAGSVLKIFETVQAVKDNKTAFQALASEAANVFSVLFQSYKAQSPTNGSSWPPSGLETTVKKLIRTLDEIIELVEQYKARSLVYRILSSKMDPGKLQELQRKMQLSIQDFEVQSHLTINTKLSEMLSSQLTRDAEAKRSASLTQQAKAMKKLEKKRHAGAGCDSAARSDIPRCLPETRETIIAAAMNWFEKAEDDQTLFWLYGPAGCGKTTIAQTIAQRCQDAKRLAASFFFSNFAATRPQKKDEFVVTLTYQLCISIPELLEFVTPALMRDPGIFDRDLSRQMQTLIIDPLNQLFQHQDLQNLEQKQWWLFLVDGLDECEGAQNQKDVLSVLSMALHQLSFPLRILVSSRPEFAIQSTITDEKMGVSTIRTIPLDIGYQTQEDIRKFIVSEFKKINEEHPSKDHLLEKNWPRPEDAQHLVNLSQGLFIYASLVMKYIGSEDDSPKNRLKEILTSTAPADTDPNDLPFAQLDAMYAHILSKVLPRNRQNVRNILRWMILGRNGNIYDNKSLKFCDLFLDFNPGETRRLLKDLTSVIDVPDVTEHYGKLKFFHASFQDFLTDPSRAGLKVPGLFCDVNEGHARLAGAWVRGLCWINSDGGKIETGEILRMIFFHCSNTTLLELLEGPFEQLDKSLSLALGVGVGSYDWWWTVSLIFQLLAWIHKQELCEYKQVEQQFPHQYLHCSVVKFAFCLVDVMKSPSNYIGCEIEGFFKLEDVPLYLMRALREACADLALKAHLWNYVNENAKGSSHALSEHCSASEMEAAMATFSDSLESNILFSHLESDTRDERIHDLCKSFTGYFSECRREFGRDNELDFKHTAPELATTPGLAITPLAPPSELTAGHELV